MNSERTAQLQVALASYDLKELRVQKRYLQEQGTAIDCTCFCSGEKLLAQLRQGVRYDAVVLCSELTDLPAEQFVRQFYQLKERPMLLIQSHGRSSGTALQKLREGCYCVEGTELKRLLWQLYRMPGRQNRQLEQRCSQLYAAWGIPQGDVNAGYLSCAVGIACSTSQKLAIRKEILQAVSEQFDTSVAAVESGIRRMVDQLEEKPPLAWLAFKADTRAGQRQTYHWQADLRGQGRCVAAKSAIHPPIRLAHGFGARRRSFRKMASPGEAEQWSSKRQKRGLSPQSSASGSRRSASVRWR
ncbi:response regulator [Faecalibacterium prausnitzii]|uniref:response regulator n=2 Tax=Faecalibacterium prausnitzii TaxID=853 RepID=UPI0032C0CD9F